MYRLFCILFAAFVICHLNGVSSNQFQYDRVDTPNSTDFEGIFNLTLMRVGKFNRTTYALYVDLETFTELDTNLEVEIKVYYNRINNNQYTLLPAQFKRDTVCNFIEKLRPFFNYDDVRNSTNIPEPKKGVRYCPVKAVNDLNLKKIQLLIRIILFYLGSLLDKGLHI